MKRLLFILLAVLTLPNAVSGEDQSFEVNSQNALYDIRNNSLIRLLANSIEFKKSLEQ